MSVTLAATPFAGPNHLRLEDPTLLNLLILDHDRFVREACREAAGTLGYRASATESIEQALWLVEAQNVDVVFLEFTSLGGSGLDVLRQLKCLRPDCEVIAITSNGTVESAVQAMKAGAFDCLPKPFGLGELRALLERIGEHLKRKTESRTFLEKNKSTRGFGSIVGRTPEMEKLYRFISKAAQSSHPVLILGESGTGKEMVARSIHFSGPFRDNPFIPVDCGSLVPTLIESELFGYVKGAFTGAMQAKQGLLEIAEGGTVFLDEVGELPLDLQAKMLRVLQEKEIRPVGGTNQVPINVRILAATNRDLERAVGQGAFRRDLYFRLNVLNLRIPPLRERRQDICLLATSFLERLSRTSDKTFEVSDEAMSALLAYDWPGNVRELENCIERCCALNSGPTIHTTDLPSSITGASGQSPIRSSESRIVRLADLERRAILGAIEQLNGDKMAAAKLLGIGKTTLYRKLKEYTCAQ